MNNKKAERTIIIVTCIFYIALAALMLYYAKSLTKAGWGDLAGVISAVVVFVPIYSIVIGIIGQIATRKVLFAPVTNAVLALLFSIVFFFTLTGESMLTNLTISLVLVVEGFIVTFIPSGVTYILQRLGKGKR